MSPDELQMGISKPPTNSAATLTTRAREGDSAERKLPPTRTGRRLPSGNHEPNRTTAKGMVSVSSRGTVKFFDDSSNLPGSPKDASVNREAKEREETSDGKRVDILRVETPNAQTEFATDLDGNLPPPKTSNGVSPRNLNYDAEEGMTTRKRAITTAAGSVTQEGSRPSSKPGSKSLNMLKALSRARSGSFRMSFSGTSTPRSGVSTPKGGLVDLLPKLSIGEHEKGGESEAKSHRKSNADDKLSQATISRSARRLIELEDRTGGPGISTIASTSREYSPLVFDSPVATRRHRGGLDEVSSFLSPRESLLLATARETPKKSSPAYRKEVRTLFQNKEYTTAASAVMEALDHCPEDARLSKAFEETLDHVAANRPYWFPERRKQGLDFKAEKRREPTPEPEEIDLLGEEWEFLLMRIEDILQLHHDPDRERRAMREALRPNISLFERVFDFYKGEEPTELLPFPDVENSDPMTTTSDFDTNKESEHEDDMALILDMIDAPRVTMSQLQLWIALKDAKIPKRDLSITEIDSDIVARSKWKPFELPGLHNPLNRLHLFEMAEVFVRISWAREIHFDTLTKRFHHFVAEILNPLELRLPKADANPDAFMRLIYTNLNTWLRPFLKQLMKFFRFVVEHEPVQDKKSIYEIDASINFNHILSLYNNLELMDPRLNVRKTMKIFESVTLDDDIVPQTHANNIDSKMNFLEFVEMLGRSAMAKAAKAFRGKVSAEEFQNVFTTFLKSDFLISASRQYPGRL